MEFAIFSMPLPRASYKSIHFALCESRDCVNNRQQNYNNQK